MVSPKQILVQHILTEYAIVAFLQSLTNAGRGEIVGADTRKRGMVLPFTPLSITFDNIKYSVDMPQVSTKQKICPIFNIEN
jgi:hypothetical protein